MTSLLLGALVTLSTPQSADFSSIDRYLQSVIDGKKTPGVSVAIVREGKPVYAKGFGLADVEKDVPVTAETVFRIGSLTKQFTATMTMQLVQEGKLKLDDNLGKLLPNTPEAWHPVTVRQLLNHTSGIPSYTDLPTFFARDSKMPTKPEGILKTVEKMKMEFEPGTRWNYNNTGYEILGILIEKEDKAPFAASLKKRILDPLQMDTTYFVSERELVKKRANGYESTPTGFRNAIYLNMDWPYAAGSIESTVLDLAKWDAALYGDKILPQTALAEMWKPTPLADKKEEQYGFGWGLGKVNKVPLIQHGGGINGFSSYIRRAPSKKLTVVVLVNSESQEPSLIAQKVMALADPELKEPEIVAEPDKDPKATEVARAILFEFLAGKLDRDRLNADMQKKISPAVQAQAVQAISSLGKLSSFNFLRETKDANGVSRFYEVKLGDTTLTYVLSFDPQGKISGLAFRPM